MPPQPAHKASSWRPAVLSWLSGVLAMGCGAGVVLWLARPQPVAVPPAVRPASVWSRLPPGKAIRERMPLTATIRWGHPARPLATPVAGNAAAADATTLAQWDGHVALDCGEIVAAQPLGLESEWQSAVSPQGPTDRLGPVVWGDDGSQRVYWRSRTSGDWDGVQVRLRACPKSPGREAGSTLRITTPQRSWTARLGWSQDDFSSIPTGPDGTSLDVHIGVDRDPRQVYGARITAGPDTPASGDRSMASKDFAEPDQPAIVTPAGPKVQ
jgi:hypothetical protein